MTFPNYVYVSRPRGLRQAIQLSQQSGDSQSTDSPSCDVRLEYAGV